MDEISKDEFFTELTLPDVSNCHILLSELKQFRFYSPVEQAEINTKQDRPRYAIVDDFLDKSTMIIKRTIKHDFSRFPTYKIKYKPGSAEVSDPRTKLKSHLKSYTKRYDAFVKPFEEQGIRFKVDINQKHKSDIPEWRMEQHDQYKQSIRLASRKYKKNKNKKKLSVMKTYDPFCWVRQKNEEYYEKRRKELSFLYDMSPISSMKKLAWLNSRRDPLQYNVKSRLHQRSRDIDPELIKNYIYNCLEQQFCRKHKQMKIKNQWLSLLYTLYGGCH